MSAPPAAYIRSMMAVMLKPQRCAAHGIRLGVTGGRGYSDATWVNTVLDAIHAECTILVLVEGGATGLDTLARAWAIARGIPVETYAPDWKQHGKAAGPIRNGQMADVIDALAAFPGGRGTADMVRQARKRRMPVYEF